MAKSILITITAEQLKRIVDESFDAGRLIGQAEEEFIVSDEDIYDVKEQALKEVTLYLSQAH